MWRRWYTNTATHFDVLGAYVMSISSCAVTTTIWCTIRTTCANEIWTINVDSNSVYGTQRWRNGTSQICIIEQYQVGKLHHISQCRWDNTGQFVVMQAQVWKSSQIPECRWNGTWQLIVWQTQVTELCQPSYFSWNGTSQLVQIQIHLWKLCQPSHGRWNCTGQLITRKSQESDLCQSS